MKRGPKHKPIKLRIIEGKRSHRKMPEELKAPDDFATMPDFLDNYGKEEWSRVVVGLTSMGILAGLDQNVLGAYCAAYSRWRHANEQLEKLKDQNPLAGLIFKTAKGNYIQQPLIGIANKAATDMVKYATEFGMTPSARARLSVSPVQKKSKFHDLIKIKG